MPIVVVPVGQEMHFPQPIQLLMVPCGQGTQGKKCVGRLVAEYPEMHPETHEDKFCKDV